MEKESELQRITDLPCVKQLSQIFSDPKSLSEKQKNQCLQLHSALVHLLNQALRTSFSKSNLKQKTYQSANWKSAGADAFGKMLRRAESACARQDFPLMPYHLKSVERSLLLRNISNWRIFQAPMQVQPAKKSIAGKKVKKLFAEESRDQLQVTLEERQRNEKNLKVWSISS